MRLEELVMEFLDFAERATGAQLGWWPDSMDDEEFNDADLGAIGEERTRQLVQQWLRSRVPVPPSRRFP